MHGGPVTPPVGTAEALKFFHADAKDKLQSIVKKRTIKLKNGFACFPDNDPLQEYVQKVKPLKTYFDVAMHGAPNAVGVEVKAPNDLLYIYPSGRMVGSGRR